MSQQYRLLPIKNMQKKFNRRICKRKFSNNHYAMFSQAKTVELPQRFNLCEYIPFIFDQNSIGSCTSNAVCMMYMIIRAVLGYEPVVFSRRWLYFMERFREILVQKNGSLPENWYDLVQTNGNLVVGDEGAVANDGIQLLIECGCPLEEDFQYIGDSNDSQVNAIPPESLKEKAKQFIPNGGADIYVDTTNGKIDGQLLDRESLEHAIKTELYVNKRPVVVGFQCMAENESSQPFVLDINGVLQVPPEDWIAIGGHEVLIVGWDDIYKSFLIQNSWGTQFGIKPLEAQSAGFFYMSYDFAFHKKEDLQQGGAYYDLACEYRTLNVEKKVICPEPEPFPDVVETKNVDLQQIHAELGNITTCLKEISASLQKLSTRTTI